MKSYREASAQSNLELSQFGRRNSFTWTDSMNLKLDIIMLKKAPPLFTLRHSLNVKDFKNRVRIRSRHFEALFLKTIYFCTGMNKQQPTSFSNVATDFKRFFVELPLIFEWRLALILTYSGYAVCFLFQCVLLHSILLAQLFYPEASTALSTRPSSSKFYRTMCPNCI